MAGSPPPIPLLWYGFVPSLALISQLIFMGVTQGLYPLQPVKSPARPAGAFVNHEGIYLSFATSAHPSPLFRAGHPGRSS